jgi:sortase A
MKENMVISIPELHIKAPVLEGTDNDVLKQAVGHFPDSGTPGHGNCCIAGHSSAIYKEYFNNIKHVEMGMTIYLYDLQKHEYAYSVTEYHIVEPNEVWVLDDFGDNRVTIVTCTDDGTQRQIVVGQLIDDAATTNETNQ